MKLFFSYQVLVIGILLFSSNLLQAENWPCWRGPRGDGTCIERDVPTNWDPAGAIWKTELPGKGHASPIVWGDRIFTVTGMTATKERVLLCLDSNTGEIIWRQTVVQGPLEKLHKENSYASGTPATDGQRVYVTFRVGDDIVVAAHDFSSGRQPWITSARIHTYWR